MDPLDDFRDAANELRPLPVDERRAAFTRLMDPLLSAFEAEARETGEVELFVERLGAVWQIGYEIGAMDQPPPSQSTN